MKIATIVGARPQFIKAAAVSRQISKTADVEEILIHTGQHYDANMSDVFFAELDIPQPSHHLGVGSGAQGAQTGRMIEAIERVLQDERPEWVIVYGDTNSTFAGALAAVKLHIPVAHVEAGLRSFNRRMPEEINRVLTDHVSTLLLVPTAVAVRNLAAEGITDRRVRVVGDVMFDVALFAGEKAATQSDALTRLGLEPGSYVLTTVHRAENTDDPARLTAIFDGLAALSRDWPVVVPLHPRTRGILAQMGVLDSYAANLRIVPPQGYLDMVALVRNARLIATDSGGVQKEAFFYQVPCVTLRDETEWVELLELGWNRLVRHDQMGDFATIAKMAAGSRPSGTGNPYGDGCAAAQIVDAIVSFAP